jgi:hypothetical protein
MRAAHDAKNLGTASPQCQRSVGPFPLLALTPLSGILVDVGRLAAEPRLGLMATRYVARGCGTRLATSWINLSTSKGLVTCPANPASSQRIRSLASS